MPLNILIRFGWIIYAPVEGPAGAIRAGILAILEALRRFQWNFRKSQTFGSKRVSLILRSASRKRAPW